MIASVALTSSPVGADPSVDPDPDATRRRDGAFGGRKLLGELLVASGGHDEVAFARFYRLTSPWIYYLLRRRLGTTAHAEDALCLVYVTIWQRAAGFTALNQSALAWSTNVAYDVVGP